MTNIIKKLLNIKSFIHKKLFLLLEQFYLIFKSILNHGEMSSNDGDRSINFDSDDDSNGTTYFSISDTDGEYPLKLYKFKPYVLLKVNYKNGNPKKYPTPRSGHRIVCDDSYLYCLGGYNPDLSRGVEPERASYLFKEFWRYNFVTKQWKLLLDQNVRGMPSELASNAICTYKNVIIAHGGTGFPFGDVCSNQCYVFSTTKSLVKRIAVEGDLPTPQYGPAIITNDNYLYTIGGTTGFEYSCDVYRLDLTTKIWECIYMSRPEMRDDPQGRYRHEAVTDGKYIYILGGGTSTVSYDLKEIPAFNLTQNRWEFIQTKPDRSVKDSSGYPEPRKCHSCIQYKTDNGLEAVITGGIGRQTKFDDIWKLQFNTLQWKLIQNVQFPKPIYFHSSCTPGNGCMYVFGGIDVQMDEINRTNNMYKMWTTIPKLSEMCWDAISYYNPILDRYSRNELLKSGIPEEFAMRVPENSRYNSLNNSERLNPPLSKKFRSLSN